MPPTPMSNPVATVSCAPMSRLRSRFPRGDSPKLPLRTMAGAEEAGHQRDENGYGCRCDDNAGEGRDGNVHFQQIVDETVFSRFDDKQGQ